MNMKKIIGLAVAVCVAVGVAVGVVWYMGVGGFGMAGKKQVSAFSKYPFSADITVFTKTAAVHNLDPDEEPGSTPETSVTYHGKMYAGHNALRTDIQMEPGVLATVIIRYDKGVAWILMPSHRYVQAPIQERTDLLSMLRSRSSNIQKKDMGPEQVGSYACEKYQVKATEKGQQESGWIWVAKAKNLKGFIVKAEDARTKEQIVLSNIQMAAPKPAVFEIPAGYKKLSKTPSAPQAGDD